MPSTRLAIAPALLPLARLAQLLESLEQRPNQDPAAYRQLVLRLQQELQTQAGQEGLPELLAHFPACAQIYENLHYGHAGLLRAPLESSVASERATTALLRRLAAKP